MDTSVGVHQQDEGYGLKRMTKQSSQLKSGIVNEIVAELTTLSKHGFATPSVSHDTSTTTAVWLYAQEVAIQVEIDWRHWDVLFSVIRLEDGQPPNGYAVSNGRPCRAYLSQLLKRKTWYTQTHDSGAARSRPKRPNDKMPRPTEQPDAARTALLDVFREELALLTDFAELLIAEQSHLFPTASEYEQAQNESAFRKAREKATQARQRHNFAEVVSLLTPYEQQLSDTDRKWLAYARYRLASAQS